MYAPIIKELPFIKKNEYANFMELSRKSKEREKIELISFYQK